MKTFRIIFGLLLALMAARGHAQSLYTNQLYNQNLFGVNAAYAGTDSVTVLAVQGRSAFNGITNAPTGGLLTLHSHLGDNVGVGGRILTDQRGAFSTFMAELAVSYRVNLSENARLQLGLNAGTIRSQIRQGYAANGFVDMRDPMLTLYDESNLLLGFAGAVIWKGFQAGVALPNLLSQENQLYNKPLIAHLMYEMELGTQWKLRPSGAMQRLHDHPTLIDGGVRAMWSDRLWVYGGYRSNGGGMFSAGVQLNRLGVSYGYESATSALATATSGSHEIMITLGLNGLVAAPRPAGN